MRSSSNNAILSHFLLFVKRKIAEKFVLLSDNLNLCCFVFNCQLISLFFCVQLSIVEIFRILFPVFHYLLPLLFYSMFRRFVQVSASAPGPI